ncbi:MAG: NAD(P)/FAD-dependent oxidoreductase, partial [Microbacterium sp.]
MTGQSDNGVDVEVLVIGAGVSGIYQLYRAREAGFTTLALEAGDGAGGVWYWNRYPGARFDSESYAYGYNFSKELFDKWRWKEEFAAQPEVEDYLNFVIDECDLRKDIRFGQRVVSADFDESAAVWTLRTGKGDVFRARYVIAATGGLSVPHYPEIDGLEDFTGLAYH